jgi:hypothetical protein
LLGASLAPAGAQQAAQGGDLVQLLSQSLDQIDEPREIQIGQQLAAVLLGSKPLYPDMAAAALRQPAGPLDQPAVVPPRPALDFRRARRPRLQRFRHAGRLCVRHQGLDRPCGRRRRTRRHPGPRDHARHRQTPPDRDEQGRARRPADAGDQLAAQERPGRPGVAQLLALGRNMYTKGLDQQDEFDADRSGVALATRAGFDPYGLVAVLQQLRTAAPDDALFALSLSTHPPAQTRLNQLEQAMGTRLDAYAGQPAVTVAQRVSASNRRPTAAQAPAKPAAKK